LRGLAARAIRTPLLPALAAGLAWLLRYWHDIGLDLGRTPNWAGWFDQSRYIASARALARFDFAAGEHWYPPAYALVASPFADLAPAQPFFLPDLILFVAAAAAFIHAMRPLGMGPWLAAAVFALSTLALAPAAGLWIEPWTTTLSAAIIWALIAVVARMIAADHPPGRGLLIAAGALAAAPPLVRPADGLVGICALAVAAAIGARRGLVTPRRIGLVLLGGVLVVLPYALLYLAIYGFRVSDYIRSGAAQGFAFGDLPWKAYVLLVTPQPWFPGERSLLETLPFLWPGCAGLVMLAVIGTARQRQVLALIAAVAIPFVAIQLAYTDFQPPGLWRFQNAHYLKWLFPLGGAGLWFWLKSFGVWRHWAVAMAATVALGALACLRILPVPVGEDRPARMLLFEGNLLRHWQEAYFASTVIRDDAGTLNNVGRFHQVPDERGERALAVARPFAGHARRLDPGESPPYTGWQAPYARYGERLSVGAPCWLDRPACALPR